MVSSGPQGTNPEEAIYTLHEWFLVEENHQPTVRFDLADEEDFREAISKGGEDTRALIDVLSSEVAGVDSDASSDLCEELAASLPRMTMPSLLGVVARSWRNEQ